MVIRRYKKKLDALFAKHAGRHVLPGDKPWMSFEEYTELITASGLCSNEFSKSATRPCFVDALMLAENELTTTAHTEMCHVEYYEMVRSPQRHRGKRSIFLTTRSLRCTDRTLDTRHGLGSRRPIVPKAAPCNRGACAGA